MVYACPLDGQSSQHAIEIPATEALATWTLLLLDG
jgi:hypothetical protein